VAQVFRKPLHPYTRALLAAVPRVEGEGPSGEELLVGEMPSAVDPPQGCRFHPRCPVAEARCRSGEPHLRAFPAGRRVACYLAEEETIRASGP